MWLTQQTEFISWATDLKRNPEYIYLSWALWSYGVASICRLTKHHHVCFDIEIAASRFKEVNKLPNVVHL